MNKKLHIYLIGIGGIGVGGLAEVLLSQGHSVFGEDLVENSVVQRLRQLGAHIHLDSDTLCWKTMDLIVYSAAVSPRQPVRLLAEKHDIPCLSRAQMLAQLVQDHKVIACTGTHGKTTTTSLMAHMLEEMNLNPGYFIGGRVASLAGLAHIGKGEWVVVEADESDASFVSLKPKIAVITNVDPDHLENFPGGFKDIQAAFLEFIGRVESDGSVILCWDNAGARSLLEHIQLPTYTYGFEEGADVRILSYEQKGLKGHVVVQFPGEAPQSLVLALPGRHNALNAVAAIMAVRFALGGSKESERESENARIHRALSNFVGVDRRMQVHGALPIAALTDKHEKDVQGHVLLLEDYGHHPVELAVTLDAVQQAWPNRRVVWVFQPHRYTRTLAFLDDFADILRKANEVVLLPVYAASEDPSSGVDSEALAEQLQARSDTACQVLSHRSLLTQALKSLLDDDDILILQGAGNIGENVLDLMQLCVAN